MIFDRLDNIDRYLGISEAFDRAISLIKTTDFTKASEGKTEVSDDVYFTKASITTSDITDSFFEVHKKYADIFIPLFIASHTIPDKIIVVSSSIIKLFSYRNIFTL